LISALSIGVSRYPQRLEWQERPWLDRAWDGTATRLHRRWTVAVWRQRWFVRRVLAAQRHLERLTEDGRRESLRALRQQLHARGPSDQRLAEAFAHARWAAGQVLGLSHYPVQIRGGYLLARGCLAEMNTGEGKTLTATLPAAAMALAGMRVQVITVNDYLAARDAEKMGPVYARLGLSCAVVRETDDEDQHRRGFAANICYCTGKTLAFDYLRDRMALGDRLQPLRMDLDGFIGRWQQSVRLPGLQCVLVDEADSIMIDEARTPLVIAADGSTGDIDFLSRSIELARALERGQDFVETEDTLGYDLTVRGRQRLDHWTRGLSGPWGNRSQREFAICRALQALHAFRRDVHYVVTDESVAIVDEQTGRIMPDRSWEAGIHQLIELKEGLPPTPERLTLARISYQLFFQRFLHLAGMSGTCREVAREIMGHYRIPVVRVPPHRRDRRRCLGHWVGMTRADKWQRVTERCRALQQAGRAVLVGTHSIEAAEELAVALTAAGVDFRLLHARQDAEEAEVIAQAGQVGQVTLATNMAGRGTDIALAPEVAARGGLHVILTERHESRRIDRQLLGRAARQGEPGSWEAILSLDDELIRRSVMARLLRRYTSGRRGRLGWPLAWLARLTLAYAQQRVERRHRRIRAQLLSAEYRLRRSLSFTGRME